MTRTDGAYTRLNSIRLMGGWEIEKMRQAGRAAAELLNHLGEMVVAGISTGALDLAARAWTDEIGYTNAPLNYRGGNQTPFPAAICTSLNNVVCHGYPSMSEILKNGDIINIDVSPIVSGYIGDTSRTFAVGQVSAVADRLIKTTQECLDAGIAVVKPGGQIGDIGAAIGKIAKREGFGIVRQFTGHGVGREFHRKPTVPHFGMAGHGSVFEIGMVFTIEPMINVGGLEVEVEPDGWVAKTKDGSLSAQFEHTVAVVPDGVEILTLSK